MRIEQLRDFAPETEDGINKEWLGIVGEDVLQNKIVEFKVAVFLGDMPIRSAPDNFEI